MRKILLVLVAVAMVGCVTASPVIAAPIEVPEFKTIILDLGDVTVDIKIPANMVDFSALPIYNTMYAAGPRGNPAGIMVMWSLPAQEEPAYTILFDFNGVPKAMSVSVGSEAEIWIFGAAGDPVSATNAEINALLTEMSDEMEAEKSGVDLLPV